MKIGLISLGCSKNLVDSEVLLAKLKSAGVTFVTNPEEADWIIVNTCGFIEDAKRESIETILELLDEGKRVLAMGCLVERYRKELEKELPEVEAYFGTQSWDDILAFLKLKPKYSVSHRILTTPRSYAYLKISEGCNRLCSFCAIPKIRGRHRSRPIEDVLNEARELVEQGVREINLVSQDTTYYGRDMYREKKLVELLKGLEGIEGLHWIRLLYLYPSDIDNELIEYIKDSEKVLPYFDIPLQHISTRVLKSMRRGYDENYVRRLVENISSSIPEAVLRTTFIVGYPVEREEDFKKLIEFVEEGHFHWVGVFTYSPEEGTHAFSLKDTVPDEEKRARKEEIMAVQSTITSRKNKELVGKELEVLVDGYSEEFSFVPVGRTYIHAPEVDGTVYIESGERMLRPGELIKVRINQASAYDLGGILLG